MSEAPRTGHEREAEVGGRRSEDPDASVELARRIATIVSAKLGEDVVALDVRGLVGYTDFLIICTARNERQAKAIHDEIHARLKREDGRLPSQVEGTAEGRWVLMDYLDCILHVFVPEMRDRYRLETLWGEAPRLELES
ncbi:MAG TPA: ribosome silencing factor [Solirubrobacterales bacterium]|nr:ribosome silencing factor [Solirubrobacterales bacterium]